MIGSNVANASKAAAARSHVCFQNRLYPLTQQQVRVSDDASAHLSGTVDATGAHGRDTIHELGLADRPQLLRPPGPVHREALQKYGGNHAMSAVQVRWQLI